MSARADIVAAARGWLGTPWLHQGRTPVGIDCAGLVAVVARDLDITDYDVGGYARHPDTTRMLALLRAGGATRVAWGEATDGDVVVFKAAAFPCHLALLSRCDGVPHIIHAHRGVGCVVEEPLGQDWLDHRVAAFRLPGVA